MIDEWTYKDKSPFVFRFGEFNANIVLSGYTSINENKARLKKVVTYGGVFNYKQNNLSINGD